MTGLQNEVFKRKHGKRSMADENFSVRRIANLLGIGYTTAKRKLQNNTFEIEEAFALFKILIPIQKQTLQMFEYLFTNEEQKGE